MDYRTIFITGAASGIGRALALALSSPDRLLYLADCNATGLQATRQGCMEKGATAHITCLDVTDREAMTRWCAQGAEHDVDLVLVCAGVTGGVSTMDQDGAAFETGDQIRRMMAVNMDGALNAILPMMARMREQPLRKAGRFRKQRGQICAIASVAGLVSYPGTPSYSASKAALDRFLIASGAYSRRAGIYLSSVCCSFVATPMVAQNRFPMPGLMRVEKATAHILHGLARRKRRIIFPSWLVLGSRFMDMLPMRLAELYYLHQPTGRPGSMPGIDNPACKDMPPPTPKAYSTSASPQERPIDRQDAAP
ncbi:SDR family NAD(P)-dependent oxidoreductase [Asaia bogorensis]|uniref:SDR family NAD(P)-dependent oxidoreductase n=1 Tax=Asaia bogorensis TaxID=91915 RepID=UPI002859DC4A|nr:SDR family NAD(P)-dependent oxidoreductase [Asaia bogorensis]MDR6183321.1 NAD(P)-dependent dehydrogenase (short-subunit alcohol dehydrogenase family) [Asaia bogorensis NBRC 16594]